MGAVKEALRNEAALVDQIDEILQTEQSQDYLEQQLQDYRKSALKLVEQLNTVYEERMNLHRMYEDGRINAEELEQKEDTCQVKLMRIEQQFALIMAQVEDQKTAWVIDPVASKYVRRIFDLALEGMNTAQISLRLNEEKIPTAGVYESHQTEDCSWSPKFIAPDSEQLWTAAKVWRILRSYEYTGALVMGKKKVLALGSKTYRSVPKSEQVIVENAHEAIVTHEEFEQAQMAIRKMGEQGYIVPKEYPLKEKVVCGNCKRRLEYAERVGGAVLFCTHKRQAGKYSKCCGDNYSEAMINARVGYAIRQMLKMVDFLKGQVVHTMTVEMPDVDKATREMEQVKAEQVRQYEAYADGVISREVYMKKKQELSRKAAELQENLDLADGLQEEEESNSAGLQELADQRKSPITIDSITEKEIKSPNKRHKFDFRKNFLKIGYKN